MALSKFSASAPSLSSSSSSFRLCDDTLSFFVFVFVFVFVSLVFLLVFQVVMIILSVRTSVQGKPLGS